MHLGLHFLCAIAEINHNTIVINTEQTALPFVKEIVRNCKMWTYDVAS